MHIVALGNDGYLGRCTRGRPACVKSIKEATPFNTKSQAERAIARTREKFPHSVNMSEAAPFVPRKGQLATDPL
jgi:hypothetical protein